MQFAILTAQHFAERTFNSWRQYLCI